MDGLNLVTCPHCGKDFHLKNKLKCLRCGYEWYAKDPEKPPKTCPNPKCKSSYWDRERMQSKRKNKPDNHIRFPE
jgi:hypothetical protein